MSIRFFKDIVCRTMHTFVPERIINPLWPGLAKEESIAHIAPILSHPYCAQIIAVSEKNCENMGHVWHLSSKTLCLLSLPLLCHCTEGKMKSGCCTTVQPASSQSCPQRGEEPEPAFLREVLRARERQAEGMTCSIRWQQKTRAGQRKERWWQARDKRTANLETVQQEGPAVWACFANWASEGYRNQVGKEGTLLIKSDGYNHG